MAQAVSRGLAVLGGTRRNPGIGAEFAKLIGDTRLSHAITAAPAPAIQPLRDGGADRAAVKGCDVEIYQ